MTSWSPEQQNDPVLKFRVLVTCCLRFWFLLSNHRTLFWEENEDHLLISFPTDGETEAHRGKGPVRRQPVGQGSVRREPRAAARLVALNAGQGRWAHGPTGLGSGRRSLRLCSGRRAGGLSAESLTRLRPDHRTFLTFQVWLSRGRHWPCGRSGLTRL